MNQPSKYVVLFEIDETQGFKVFDNKHQAVAFILKNEEDWTDYIMYRSYGVSKYEGR